jgi:hypothetical protein
MLRITAVFGSLSLAIEVASSKVAKAMDNLSSSYFAMR